LDLEEETEYTVEYEEDDKNDRKTKISKRSVKSNALSEGSKNICNKNKDQEYTAEHEEGENESKSKKERRLVVEDDEDADYTLEYEMDEERKLFQTAIIPVLFVVKLKMKSNQIKKS